MEIILVSVVAFLVTWGYCYIDERHGLSSAGGWRAFALVLLSCVTASFLQMLEGEKGFVYLLPFICAVVSALVAGSLAGSTVGALGKHLSRKERERLARNNERTDPIWVRSYVGKKIQDCRDLFVAEKMPQHLGDLLKKLEGLIQNTPVYFQLLRTPIGSAPSGPATISGTKDVVE
jgi:hypothetical protein